MGGEGGLAGEKGGDRSKCWQNDGIVIKCVPEGSNFD